MNEVAVGLVMIESCVVVVVVLNKGVDRWIKRKKLPLVKLCSR